MTGVYRLVGKENLIDAANNAKESSKSGVVCREVQVSKGASGREILPSPNDI